jgi:hypothetical protein
MKKRRLTSRDLRTLTLLSGLGLSSAPGLLGEEPTGLRATGTYSSSLLYLALVCLYIDFILFVTCYSLFLLIPFFLFLKPTTLCSVFSSYYSWSFSSFLLSPYTVSFSSQCCSSTSLCFSSLFSFDATRTV